MSTWQGVLFCVGYAVLLAAVMVGTWRLVFGREWWSLLCDRVLVPGESGRVER